MIDKKHKYIGITAVIISFILGFTMGVEAAPAGKDTKAFDFKLSDVNGITHTLADYKKNDVVVVIYVSTRCPVSNAYNKRMAQLYKDFKGKNVAFIGINSNKAESVEEIKKHAKENGLMFPVLKDNENKIADRYEASVTPEAYVFGKNWELLYHGRIDDAWKSDERVQSRDLYNALKEITTGKPVSVKKTKAFGCTIKRIKKS